ncbi:MAG: sodium/proline symporter, partial [Planctomycetes bacterium]|nr:sodium/proline symporter [Planctomycetota bacterium]
MAEPNMTVIVVAFAIYTIVIVGVGLYSARFARRSDEDYFLAGRSLGPWVAAMSASASAESGWVTMGLVGLAFSVGYSAYWLIPGVCLGYIFNWFFMAARLRDRSADLGALTLPDVFAMHFRERLPILRLLSVLVILVAMLLYVAAQFAAAGKAFDFAFGDNVSYWQGVIIGGVIVLLYTVIGG